MAQYYWFDDDDVNVLVKTHHDYRLKNRLPFESKRGAPASPPISRPPDSDGGADAPAEPESCRDAICELDCGKHGTCVDGGCKCRSGWRGEFCREPACGTDSRCSGHGVCTFGYRKVPAPNKSFLQHEQTSNKDQEVALAGICRCDAGFTGETCSKQAFHNRECPNSCNANGVCLDGKCVCTEGFVGTDCSKKVCRSNMAGPNCDQQQCPNSCSSHGLCFNGKCACGKEYMWSG